MLSFQSSAAHVSAGQVLNEDYCSGFLLGSPAVKLNSLCLPTLGGGGTATILKGGDLSVYRLIYKPGEAARLCDLLWSLETWEGLCPPLDPTTTFSVTIGEAAVKRGRDYLKYFGIFIAVDPCSVSPGFSLKCVPLKIPS